MSQKAGTSGLADPGAQNISLLNLTNLAHALKAPPAGLIKTILARVVNIEQKPVSDPGKMATCSC
jgi:hypothetical protein